MFRASVLTAAVCAALGLGVSCRAAAQLPAAASDPLQAQAATTAAPADDADKVFTLFRHDLINLLVLGADPRKLVAAAQIAAPDEKDATRSALKKTPGLIKRAQQFGPQDPLVLWVAASNACLSKPGCADPAAMKSLQLLDADNAAVWLLGFPADGNAEKSRLSVARMAQTQRYDDYWAADVVALYHALETLPVPRDVLAQGVGSEAARINFATSIASAILPMALQRLGKFCTSADAKDGALVADCLAVARKLESGGTFISQATGFAIEEALLAPGVDRDVMGARKRSALWQKQQFFELSARFTRDPALAQSYVRLLGSEQTALGAVLALLREQNLHTDPPAGWRPAPASNGADPLQSPATNLPATQP
jgi:hypothetical protein